MKHLIPWAAIALMLLTFNAPAQAQTYTGNLYLSSQADVDAFAYTEITGTLNVSGADIVDLSPLSGLTTVGQSLWIYDNTSLIEVNGFESLTSTGWGVYFYQNPNLISVDAFHALQSTGDNIEFYANDLLESVSGFDLLHTAGWSLEFGSNPKLVNIPEFESLTTITSSLFIYYNDSLSEITGFNNLNYVDWSIWIGGNGTLSNLCGFYNYFSANNPYTGGGALDIEGNHPDLPSPTSIQDILDAGPCFVSPEEQIEDLVTDIEAADLPKGTTNSFTKSLNNAAKSLDKGNQRAAINQLEALVNKINAQQRRGTIGADVAGELIDAVFELIDSIGS